MAVSSLVRPKIALRYGRTQEPIRVPTNDLLVDPLATTFLTADTASGVSTLTVKNILNFAVNQILLIGELGNQGSEIIKVHASSAPSGSTITLASNTVFPHSASTAIRVINFDQVEFSTATTLTGSKSVLSTTNIVADQLDTLYNDTAGSTGFYFARYKNSITAAFSSYSDGTPVTGYTKFMARSIIDSALGMINKTTSKVLTDEFAFQQIDNCQEETLRELKRWSFMEVYDYVLGQSATGTYKIATPSDLDDTFSNKSIYNFRLGTDPDMIWIDKEKWDEILVGTAHTTLASAISLNDVTITLTSSGDFSDAGAITIGANTYTYSANNRTTNVLTITAATTTNANGTDVFQGGSVGEPRFWTIFGDGYIRHYPITGSSFTQRNYKLDYYKQLTAIVNDTDTIVLPDPTVIQYYLAWKFLLKLNNGIDDGTTQPMFAQYVSRREKMKMKETMNRTVRLKSRTSAFSFDDHDSEAQRTGNFPNS